MKQIDNLALRDQQGHPTFIRKTINPRPLSPCRKFSPFRNGHRLEGIPARPHWPRSILRPKSDRSTAYPVARQHLHAATPMENIRPGRPTYTPSQRTTSAHGAPL
jgi:hypothetical protein